MSGYDSVWPSKKKKTILWSSVALRGYVQPPTQDPSGSLPQRDRLIAHASTKYGKIELFTVLSHEYSVLRISPARRKLPT